MTYRLWETWMLHSIELWNKPLHSYQHVMAYRTEATCLTLDFWPGGKRMEKDIHLLQNLLHYHQLRKHFLRMSRGLTFNQLCGETLMGVFQQHGTHGTITSYQNNCHISQHQGVLWVYCNAKCKSPGVVFWKI